jgi:hypothetical protein
MAQRFGGKPDIEWINFDPKPSQKVPVSEQKVSVSEQRTGVQGTLFDMENT